MNDTHRYALLRSQGSQQSLPQRSDNRKRYETKTPPENKTEAVEAVGVLEGEILRMQTDIDMLDEDSYPRGSGLDYQGWKRIAINALGRTRAEVHFLNRWIKEHQKATRPTHSRVVQASKTTDQVKPESEVVIQSIQRKAEELAAEIERDYQSVYSASKPPTDLDTAMARSTVVSSIKMRLQGAFAEITGLWRTHQLVDDRLPAIKAPLLKILTVIEQELLVLRDCRRVAGANRDWKALCLQALTRAQTEGFVLQPDEMVMLEQLRTLFSQKL